MNDPNHLKQHHRNPGLVHAQVEKRGEVGDTIMDTIEAPRCFQRGFVLPSFKELLLESMMEAIYKIIQRVKEGELKQ